MKTKQPPPATFADYADLADSSGAGTLAAMLRTCIPHQPLPPVPTTDPRPALDRLRRLVEQTTALRIHYDPSFKTWGYGPDHRHTIEGFPHLAHALVAGIRYQIAPIEPFALRIATREDWAWLKGFPDSSSNGVRLFRLYEDARLYWHVPGAEMLLLLYVEPAEFGRTTPAVAGFCFFGSNILGIIESRYAGGGSLMISWLQERAPYLIAHHVLSDQSVSFLTRNGFVAVQPPLPEHILPMLRMEFPKATSAEGHDGRQRIMVWPASLAEDAHLVATHLSAAHLKWWHTRRRRMQRDDPEELAHVADFMWRAFGTQIRMPLVEEEE